MNVLIVPGHTMQGTGTGANAYINESEENRTLSKIVVKYLEYAGHNVDYYEVNEATDYLAKQVAKANSKDYDLVVQIHFNAHKTTENAMGTETYYISDSGKVWAEKVNDKLSTVFKNRGVKKGEGLYWLKNSKPIAILIETCFVDSKSDTNTYKLNKEYIGRLIAEAINRKEIKEVKQSEVFYRVVAGSYSNKENAQKQIENLKKKGIDNAFIDVYKK